MPRGPETSQFQPAALLDGITRLPGNPEDREKQPTQTAVRLGVIPVNDWVLRRPGAIEALQAIAAHRPFYRIKQVPIPRAENIRTLLGESHDGPYPETLATVLKDYQIELCGVCGSDKKLFALQMGLTSLLDAPNVPSQSLVPYIAFVQTHFPNWQPGIILREFTAGHEIAARNGDGKRGTFYPIPGACRFWMEESKWCSCCANGKDNLCLFRRYAPIRGFLGFGAEVIVTQKEGREFGVETGAGFGKHMVYPSNAFIELDDMDAEQIVMIDSAACVWNGLKRVIHRIDNDTTIGVVGAGIMGLWTLVLLEFLRRTKKIEIDPRKVAVLVKHPQQAELVKSFAFKPFFYSPDGEHIVRFAEHTGDKIIEFGDSFYINGGCNLVFECVGNDKTISDAIRIAGPSSDLVMLGLPQRKMAIEMDEIERGETTVYNPRWASWGDFMQVIDIMRQDMEQGREIAEFCHQSVVSIPIAQADLVFQPQIWQPKYAICT